MMLPLLCELVYCGVSPPFSTVSQSVGVGVWGVLC